MRKTFLLSILRSLCLTFCMLQSSCWAQEDGSGIVEQALARYREANVATTDEEYQAVIADVVELATLGISANPPRQQLAVLHAIRGNARLRQHQPSTALLDFSDATRLAPEEAEFWFLRAYANELVGNYTAAIDELGRILEIESADHGRALGNRANLLIEIGEYRRAIQDLTAVIVEDPNDALDYSSNSDHYERRGDAFAALGWVSEAIADYKSAIAAAQATEETLFGENLPYSDGYNPGELDLHVKIGSLYEELGELDLALREYEAVLAIEPNFAEALNALEELRSREQAN